MTKEVIIAIIGLFLITSLTNILATLKTILVSKKIMNPVYLLVFIDAVIFASVLTKVTSSNGFHFTIAYALGKTMGVFLGGIVEDRLALGIIEVDVFLSDKVKMNIISEKLRNLGYTVNSYAVRGMNGEKRYKIEVVLQRKEYKFLEQVLDNNGVVNPTLKIKNLSKVVGKITTTSQTA